MSSVARAEIANLVVTGMNLEDVLAEYFYKVMRWELPSPFPKMLKDSNNFCYTLYRCSKRIIDSCYPKFSLDNYLAHYPSILYWRALSDYLAQSASTVVTVSEVKLIDSFQSLSEAAQLLLTYVEELGFSADSDLSSD